MHYQQLPKEKVECKSCSFSGFLQKKTFSSQQQNSRDIVGLELDICEYLYTPEIGEDKTIVK